MPRTLDQPAAGRAATASREPAGPADPAAEVSFVLERLHSWLRQATPAVEWNSVALSTLALLGRRGRLRITQPGMTSLVARMATAGLVVKEADPADGRATLVSVTPAGHAYLEQIHERRAEVIAGHVRGLSPARLQSLIGALDALETLAAQPITPGAEPR
jgi:hypothetical protein